MVWGGRHASVPSLDVISVTLHVLHDISFIYHLSCRFYTFLYLDIDTQTNQNKNLFSVIQKSKNTNPKWHTTGETHPIQFDRH